MAIKKFGSPEDNTPKPEDKSGVSSRFDPWLNKDDPKKKPLGERVYTSQGQVEGKYTDLEELQDALLLAAQEAFDKVQELLKLYGRASAVPTRANVDAYIKAIKEVIEGDPKMASAVLSVIVATFTASMGSGRRR